MVNRCLAFQALMTFLTHLVFAKIIFLETFEFSGLQEILSAAYFMLLNTSWPLCEHWCQEGDNWLFFNLLNIYTTNFSSRLIYVKRQLTVQTFLFQFTYFMHYIKFQKFSINIMVTQMTSGTLNNLTVKLNGYSFFWG